MIEPRLETQVVSDGYPIHVAVWPAPVPVRGRIVASSAQTIAVARHDEEAGDIVVHFPRAGFLVTPVAA